MSLKEPNKITCGDGQTSAKAEVHVEVRKARHWSCVFGVL
jgi:hypothetical protein